MQQLNLNNNLTVKNASHDVKVNVTCQDTISNLFLEKYVIQWEPCRFQTVEDGSLLLIIRKTSESC